jgi:hypothetical protein
MHPLPPPSFRASDADREAVVAHLNAAVADGRLSLSEFDTRTRHVYRSRTWGELLRIVHDLPPLLVKPGPPKPAAAPAWPQVALGLGIASLPTAFCAPVGITAGVLAVVFGVLGLRSSSAPSQPAGRHGQALAGLICGAFGTALSIWLAILIAGLDH